MKMSAIGVIATLRVQAGKEAEFEGVFAELAPAVAANEPGNSYYRLFRTAEAGVYKVLECYDDDAAVEAHRASDHFRTLGAKLGPCLAGAPEIERLAAV
jgi:quinol monooxygenase YgiN